MGRFSSWAQDRVAHATQETTPGDPIPYLVDNNELKSTSKRLKWRLSPSLQDKDDSRGIKFGAVIRGVPTADGAWLRVGNRYLPMLIGGCKVLVRVAWDNADLLSQLGQEEEDSDSDSKLFEKELLKWKSVVPPPSTRRSLEPGSGATYEVVANRIFVRAAPGLQARVCGTRSKGQLVELFDWDSTRLWRRLVSTSPLTEGWVLLDHSELGPLLRPHGLPFSVRPLEPMCVAAMEGSWEDLRQFLNRPDLLNDDERVAEAQAPHLDRREPLGLAAAAGSVKSCFILLEAGARPISKETLTGLQTIKDEDNVERTGPAAAALCLAASGYPYREQELEIAYMFLAAEELRVARRMVQIAQEQAKAKESKRSFQPQGVQQGSINASLAKTEDIPEAALATSTTVDDVAPQGVLPSVPPPTLVPEPKGNVYEVLHSMIFIRSEPDRDAQPVSSLRQGDRVDTVGSKDNWLAVHVQKPQGLVTGWVLLKHPSLGILLRQCED